MREIAIKRFCYNALNRIINHALFSVTKSILFSPQVYFPQPVVAVAVIVHLGSDGYTPVNTNTKYMHVDLITPENLTVPVEPSNIPVSCQENPVHVPIKQDLSKPFILTQGKNLDCLV